MNSITSRCLNLLEASLLGFLTPLSDSEKLEKLLKACEDAEKFLADADATEKSSTKRALFMTLLMNSTVSMDTTFEKHPLHHPWERKFEISAEAFLEIARQKDLLPYLVEVLPAIDATLLKKLQNVMTSQACFGDNIFDDTSLALSLVMCLMKDEKFADEELAKDAERLIKQYLEALKRSESSTTMQLLMCLFILKTMLHPVGITKALNLSCKYTDELKDEDFQVPPMPFVDLFLHPVLDIVKRISTNDWLALHEMGTDFVEASELLNFWPDDFVPSTMQRLIGDYLHTCVTSLEDMEDKSKSEALLVFRGYAKAFNKKDELNLEDLSFDDLVGKAKEAKDWKLKGYLDCMMREYMSDCLKNSIALGVIASHADIASENFDLFFEAVTKEVQSAAEVIDAFETVFCSLNPDKAKEVFQSYVAKFGTDYRLATPNHQPNLTQALNRVVSCSDDVVNEMKLLSLSEVGPIDERELYFLAMQSPGEFISRCTQEAVSSKGKALPISSILQEMSCLTEITSAREDGPKYLLTEEMLRVLAGQEKADKFQLFAVHLSNGCPKIGEDLAVTLLKNIGQCQDDASRKKNLAILLSMENDLADILEQLKIQHFQNLVGVLSALETSEQDLGLIQKFLLSVKSEKVKQILSEALPIPYKYCFLSPKLESGLEANLYPYLGEKDVTATLGTNMTEEDFLLELSDCLPRLLPGLWKVLLDANVPDYFSSPLKKLRMMLDAFSSMAIADSLTLELAERFTASLDKWLLRECKKAGFDMGQCRMLIIAIVQQGSMLSAVVKENIMEVFNEMPCELFKYLLEQVENASPEVSEESFQTLTFLLEVYPECSLKKRIGTLKSRANGNFN